MALKMGKIMGIFAYLIISGFAMGNLCIADNEGRNDFGIKTHALFNKLDPL